MDLTNDLRPCQSAVKSLSKSWRATIKRVPPPPPPSGKHSAFRSIDDDRQSDVIGNYSRRCANRWRREIDAVTRVVSADDVMMWLRAASVAGCQRLVMQLRCNLRFCKSSLHHFPAPSDTSPRPARRKICFIRLMSLISLGHAYFFRALCYVMSFVTVYVIVE